MTIAHAHRAALAALLLVAAAPPVLAHDTGADASGHAHDAVVVGFPADDSDTKVRFTSSREGRPLPLPEEDDAFVFAIFGDRTGGPAEGVKVLAEAVQAVNLIDPDLVMTVGDLVQGYNQTDRWMVQMREFRGIMDGLTSPWFPIAGNHDVYWRGPGRPEGEHEAHYETHFGPLWYAFEHKDCAFIALYTDEGDPESGRKDFNDPTCQRMSPEQKAWLERTLAEVSDARHVFVFMHHPRWLGGNYGDDWDAVHELLVSAGNVTAVFAGHIHQMRSDGPRDGIEYMALATVGGGQSSLVPSAGYLHQYHLVTVRDETVAITAYPVGVAMDPRAITGTVNEETRRLAQTAPAFDGRLVLESDGGASGTVTATLANPTSRPVEVSLVPDSDDPRWMLWPDHVHRTLAPGERLEVAIEARRVPGGIDDTLRMPRLRLDADYLAETARFPLETRRLDLPLRVELPTVAARDDRALDLDGRRDAVRIAAEDLALPDGPLTVELWLQGDDFSGRRGLATKTENSEFGIFVSDGRADFSVLLDGSYRTARTDAVVFEPGRWHHVAGVYDGREVRVYVDGRRVASAPASGTRRTNRLPFFLGADVDGAGNPVSWFDGRVDELRISTVARYAGESFTPARRHVVDEGTALLLSLDARVGPFVADRSARAAHGRILGRPGEVAAR